MLAVKVRTEYYDIYSFVISISVDPPRIRDAIIVCENDICVYVKSFQSILETFADSSPLEYYSEIPRGVRLDRFYSLLEIGDVIEGHVCRKIPLAIEGIIDRFSESQKKRYIQDLDIRCILKITDMGKSHSDQEVVYNDFRNGDVFKGHRSASH